jgi:hypothetical protein
MYSREFKVKAVRLSQLKGVEVQSLADALACTFMPFGTVLGVFTIIVLQKEPVRQLFGHSPPSPPVIAA